MKINYVKPKMIICNFDHLKDSKLVQPTEVDALRYEEIEKSDGTLLVQRNNDVSLLFNQKRIADELGRDNLNHFIERINAASNEPGSRHQLTDDVLLKFVKSRHIQSMSELEAWSHYLTDNAASVINEFKSLHDEQTIQNTSKDHSDPGNNIPGSVPSGTDS